MTDTTDYSHKPSAHLLDELKWVHAAIRHDLATCRTLAAQVADGASPEHIKAELKALQTSGPLWQLRINCLYYCRFVHAHHHHEDILLFPALRQSNAALRPIVDQLEADHRHVSDLLDDIEAAANDLGGRDADAARLRLVAGLNDLAADLLAHLAFEEESIGPTLLEWTSFPRVVRTAST